MDRVHYNGDDRLLLGSRDVGKLIDFDDVWVPRLILLPIH